MCFAKTKLKNANEGDLHCVGATTKRYTSECTHIQLQQFIRETQFVMPTNNSVYVNLYSYVCL